MGVTSVVVILFAAAAAAAAATPSAATSLSAAAAASSIVAASGADRAPHDATLAAACADSIKQTSEACCAAVFATALEGGVGVLCNAHEGPYAIALGFGWRFFVQAYLKCGGHLPDGSTVASVCAAEDLAESGTSPPPPASVTPPLLTPPSVGVVSSPPPPPPPSHGSDAPLWMEPLMKALYVIIPTLGVLAFVAGLFYCIHLGGSVGAAATLVLKCLLNLVTCFAVGWIERARPQAQIAPRGGHSGGLQSSGGLDILAGAGDKGAEEEGNAAGITGS